MAGLVIVGAIVTIGIVSWIQDSRLASSTKALEQLERTYSGWLELDEAGQKDKADALLSEAAALGAKYPKLYAGAKALMIQGMVQNDSGNIEAAEKIWAALATAQPESHLAPVALVNASTAAENKGNNEAALSYLNRYLEKYPGSAGQGRVLLSIGRIYESMKQYDKALETYTKLVASGDDSDWTKLAHDRIISVRSSGLVQ